MSTNYAKEESITEDPEEEPFTEDSKRVLSPKNFKRTLSLRNLKRTLSLRILRSFRFALQKALFRFLVMIYDRVGDGDKFSYENFGLGRPRFHATSHLNIETK